MFQSTRKSRRHRNPQPNEENKQPFFSKAGDGSDHANGHAPFFQAKLAIGRPGDPYEREADAVADRVVSGKAQNPVVQQQTIHPVQRESLATPIEDEKLGTAEARMEKDKLVQEKPELQRMEEEEPLQMQEEEEEPVQMQAEEEEPLQMQEEEELQMQAEEEEEPVQMQEEEEEPIQMQEEEEELQAKAEPAAPARASSHLSRRIQSGAGKGKPLPGHTRAEMESAFGLDFSGVNVHTGQEAVGLNKELGAQAFTHGKNVYFNQGKFRPESTEGKRLLAHELTHVVQQGGGRQKSIQRQPAPAVAKTMKSPRFKGDPVLDEVLNGKRFLKSGDSGDHVTRIQQGLMDAGQPLKNFGPDGKFGSETKKAVIAFQEAHGLGKDGVIGTNTMGTLDLYLSISPGPAPLPPEKGSALEALKALLAKGAAMTKVEAKQARDLLFQLNNDEFRVALKTAITNGSFFAMFGKLSLADMLKTAANLTREVVIPVTLLKPASDTVDADFKRANEIYNPHNIEIEKGNRMDIEEKETKKIIGNDLVLDEFTGADATKEELELIKRNRVKGRMTGYWVPDMTSSRGEALDSSLGNLPDDRISVVTNTSSRAQDTFAHEAGHALGLDHDLDPNNLMAGGDIRNITGPGIDQLTDAQIATIRGSLFIEIGKKGLGQ